MKWNYIAALVTLVVAVVAVLVAEVVRRNRQKPSMQSRRTSKARACRHRDGHAVGMAFTGQKYMVRLEGRNFWVKWEGEILLMGFFTTRFVEAASPDSAAQVCTGLVSDEFSAWAMNASGDPPRVSVTEVVEVSSFGDYEVPGSGATWFEDEDRREN